MGTSTSVNFFKYRPLSFGSMTSAYSLYALVESFKSSLIRLRVRSWVSWKNILTRPADVQRILHLEIGELTKDICCQGCTKGLPCLSFCGDYLVSYKVTGWMILTSLEIVPDLGPGASSRTELSSFIKICISGLSLSMQLFEGVYADWKVQLNNQQTIGREKKLTRLLLCVS